MLKGMTLPPSGAEEDNNLIFSSPNTVTVIYCTLFTHIYSAVLCNTLRYCSCHWASWRANGRTSSSMAVLLLWQRYYTEAVLPGKLAPIKSVRNFRAAFLSLSPCPGRCSPTSFHHQRPWTRFSPGCRTPTSPWWDPSGGRSPDQYWMDGWMNTHIDRISACLIHLFFSTPKAVFLYSLTSY